MSYFKAFKSNYITVFCHLNFVLFPFPPSYGYISEGGKICAGGAEGAFSVESDPIKGVDRERWRR